MLSIEIMFDDCKLQSNISMLDNWLLFVEISNIDEDINFI